MAQSHTGDAHSSASRDNPAPKQGVVTEYAGCTFRSRLEAKWAAFADLADWPWVYEPFDGNGYLPDFSFTVSGRPILVEVKPVATIDDARQHMPKIVAGIGDMWGHDIIVAGIDPLHTLYIDFLNGPDDYHPTAAEITMCARCALLKLHPITWTMECGHCQSTDSIGAVQYAKTLWRQAGNLTKWNPFG